MNGRSKAGRVVYPAIFGALALVLLYLGTLFPTGTWGIAAVAGIMPVFAVLSFAPLQIESLCASSEDLMGSLLWVLPFLLALPVLFACSRPWRCTPACCT